MQLEPELKLKGSGQGTARGVVFFLEGENPGTSEVESECLHRLHYPGPDLEGSAGVDEGEGKARVMVMRKLSEKG